MNAHSPNQIEPFKLGHGRPLSAMVQEMIAKEMMRGIPRECRPKKWASDRGPKVRRWEVLTPQIVALYQGEGLSAYAISRRLSMSVPDVGLALRESGITPRRGGSVAAMHAAKEKKDALRREITPDVLRLRAMSLSMDSIAERLGTTRHIVKRILIDEGAH